MPGIRESSKNLAQPATHCSRRILLYHPRPGPRKGQFTFQITDQAVGVEDCREAQNKACAEEKQGREDTLQPAR